jgi:geranylgeranyl diphosphate synthase type I
VSHPFKNLETYLDAIEAEMRSSAALSCEEALASYYGMMFYHLGWADETFSPRWQKSGKRLRPLLCLLSCEACGGDWHQALPAAATVELIHNFSLIHDDIEDGSLERRHRPTLWSLWGQAQAINAGDGLFAISRLALQRLPERGVPLEKTVSAFRVVDETCLALTEGQYLDLSFEERDDVSVEMYMQMIGKKTASLIACAMQLGSLLGTNDQGMVKKYRQFGHQLGLAFQIIDDILGIWGEEETTGKGVGEDILNKKKSLPVVYALETGDGELEQIYNQERIAARDVQIVMERLNELGAREYASSRATDHWQLALDTLQRTGIENPAQETLRELAIFLVERQY